MDALLHSTLLVFGSEIGDKTQLLTLVLAARFGRPWTIILGIFVATVLNHALAALVGAGIANLLGPDLLRWVLAGVFLAFAAWILIPDKSEDLKSSDSRNVFITTVVAFFLAEMGDKTQLATIALGARYSSTTMVTLGSTLGMLLANAPAAFFGEKFLKIVPLKAVRIIASILFVAFAVYIFFSMPHG